MTTATSGGFTQSVSNNRGGWTGGGGVELGWGNLSTKAEYLYLQTFDRNDTFFGVGYTSNVYVHTVKLGLNYRFGL
jgi:opacity protein-like surface antigen